MILWGVITYPCTGPCITNVIATCRKNFSQWESSLKFLRRVAKTLVIQGPGLPQNTCGMYLLISTLCLHQPLKWFCIGNHQQLDCLFISLIRLTPKKVNKSKSCIYGTTLEDEHLLLTEKILLLFLLWFILSYMFHRPENLLRDGGTHIHLLWGGGSGHSYSLIGGGALTSNVHVFTI